MMTKAQDNLRRPFLLIIIILICGVNSFIGSIARFSGLNPYSRERGGVLSSHVVLKTLEWLMPMGWEGLLA
jgi:hypothetical protein